MEEYNINIYVRYRYKNQRILLNDLGVKIAYRIYFKIGVLLSFLFYRVLRKKSYFIKSIYEIRTILIDRFFGVAKLLLIYGN